MPVKERATTLDNLFLSWLFLDKPEAIALPEYDWPMRDSILEFSEWLTVPENQETLREYLASCIKRRQFKINPTAAYSVLLDSFVAELAALRTVTVGSRWIPKKFGPVSAKAASVVSIDSSTVTVEFEGRYFSYALEDFLGISDNGRLNFYQVKQRPSH